MVRVVTARRCQGCDRPIGFQRGLNRCQECQEADRIIRDGLTGRAFSDAMRDAGILTPDRIKSGRIKELSPQAFVAREDENGSAQEQVERLFSGNGNDTSWQINSSNPTVERAKRTVSRYDNTEVGQQLRGELEALLDSNLEPSQVASIILSGVARQKAPPWTPKWVKHRTIGEMFDGFTRLSDQVPQPRGAKRRHFVERELDRIVSLGIPCQHSSSRPKQCMRCDARPAIIRTQADEHLCFRCDKAAQPPPDLTRVGWRQRTPTTILPPKAEVPTHDDAAAPCPECRGDTEVTSQTTRRGAIVRQHECLNAACATVFRSVEIALTEDDAARLTEIPQDEWQGAVADMAATALSAHGPAA